MTEWAPISDGPTEITSPSVLLAGTHPESVNDRYVIRSINYSRRDIFRAEAQKA